MNLLQILPAFHEGGVERHVLWFSNALSRRGHNVLVVSAGGKLESGLSDEVAHIRLPVHRKNPLTAAYSSISLSSVVKSGKYDLIHAHSRVPAWISWWTSFLTNIPWVVTCHGNYSLNAGLKPYRHSYGAICVSESVRDHLGGFLPSNSVVIPNGLPEPDLKWEGPQEERTLKLLFIGRLTRVKGLDVLLAALGDLASLNWSLDILGDGPMRRELEVLTESLGLSNHVHFRGFREDTDLWMKNASLMIFPSRSEGMPLTLCRAVQMKVPFLASDIPAIREMVDDEKVLFPSENTQSLASRISAILDGQESPVQTGSGLVLNLEQMVDRVENFYLSVLNVL